MAYILSSKYPGNVSTWKSVARNCNAPPSSVSHVGYWHDSLKLICAERTLYSTVCSTRIVSHITNTRLSGCQWHTFDKVTASTWLRRATLTRRRCFKVIWRFCAPVLHPWEKKILLLSLFLRCKIIVWWVVQPAGHSWALSLFLSLSLCFFPFLRLSLSQ